MEKKVIINILFLFVLLFKKRYCNAAAKIINLIHVVDLDKANSSS